MCFLNSFLVIQLLQFKSLSNIYNFSVSIFFYFLSADGNSEYWYRRYIRFIIIIIIIIIIINQPVPMIL